MRRRRQERMGGEGAGEEKKGSMNRGVEVPRGEKSEWIDKWMRVAMVLALGKWEYLGES
jgi:hypothetical protein